MLDIQRVKKVCKWLIYNDYADNDSELAKLIGYTKSSFSQIMNEKVPLSSKFISKLCEIDNRLNFAWILRNEGGMLNDFEGDYNNLKDKIVALEIEIQILKNTIKDRDTIIEIQSKLISKLEKDANYDKSKSRHTVANVTK